MSESMWLEGALIVVGFAILLRAAWYAWSHQAARLRDKGHVLVPGGMSLRPQPVLTKPEAELYNLLRLTVQDQYLVFPKVPIWSVIAAIADKTHDQSSAASLFRSLPKKRMDFVLVHPGTLAVDTVVLLHNGTAKGTKADLPNQPIRKLCNEAGIRQVTLEAGQTYTVPALAALLEVDYLE